MLSHYKFAQADGNSVKNALAKASAFFCHCTTKEMHFGFDHMVLNHHDLKNAGLIR